MPRSWHKRGFEHLALGLGIEREEPSLLLRRPRAAAALDSAAAKDKAALGFVSQGYDALVRDQVAVVLDGLVLQRVPHAQRAAELSVGRFTADVDQPARAANHRARPQVAVAYSAEVDRVAIRAGPKLPRRLGGIIEGHHSAGVVTDVELAVVLDHRIGLTARHGAKMLAAPRSWIVAKDLHRQRRAAIDRPARTHAHHENHVPGTGVFERALLDLPSARVAQRERAAPECGHHPAIPELERREAGDGRRTPYAL